MKRFWKRAVPLVFSVAAALGVSVTAAGAAYADFQDVKGHWADETLRQAHEAGLLNGYDEKTMAPDNSITTAQAAAILCRVLHVTGQGDISGFSIPGNAWYKQDVAKAVYAGLLDESAADKLEKPITRGEAFCLFARAFQVTQVEPEPTLLESFQDGRYLTGEVQEAAAALVATGAVGGSDDGLLHPERSLTRAEFSTILFRLANVYTTAADFDGNPNGGTVLSGDASLSGLTAGDVWFDHAASHISLEDVDASLVTVRSDALESLSISGESTIEALVLAANTGDVTLNLSDLSVGTFTVGEGSGEVVVTGGTGAVAVTGDDRTVTVTGEVSTLSITGDNNTVTVNKDCKLDAIVIRGTGNVLKLDAKADTLLLAGRDNTVKGRGRVETVNLNTRYYDLDVSAKKVNPWETGGLENVEASLSAPGHIPAGQSVKATADLTVPEGHEGKLCTGSWYLNGTLMAEGPVLLGKDVPACDFTPVYDHSLPWDSTLQFVLRYTNSDGDTDTLETSTALTTANYTDLGLADTVVTVHVPELLPAGKTLQVTAAVDSPEVGKVCHGYWYVDGKEVAHGPLTLTPGKEAYLNYNYSYYYGMPEQSTVKLVVTYVTADGREQEVSGEAVVSLENFADNGIAGASATLAAPGTLEAGQELVVTAKVNYLEAGKVCTADWYVDDKKVSTQTVVLGTDTPTLKHTYTYSEDMKLTSRVKLVLSYKTPDGRSQEVGATRDVKLKNYGYLYYHGMTEADVLNAVTSSYAGNYTLQWALNHDYDPELKTAWVNLKGYKSNSKYLVWVNLTYQRVNIFEGSQGNWKLIRECLCGSGAPGTPTIRGVFTTSYKQAYWDYGSYYCGPVVRFYGTSGYAFHSRKEYWPMNSDRYLDGRIGFPISHGCLRMYNDDIWFMYNNIPNGTTVVVH